MRLVLVRHGDAYAGFQGRGSGPTGCPGLTPLGRRQAEAFRDHLASAHVRADVLLASCRHGPSKPRRSSLRRSASRWRHFARECDLCELHTGDADGLEWAEYAVRHGSFDMEAEPDRVFAPAGESWNSFHVRVQGMLERSPATTPGRPSWPCAMPG